MGKLTKMIVERYLNNIAAAKPYYMWGMDMDIITPDRVEALKKTYGEKYKDVEKKYGYLGCDCSGLMTKLTGNDMTAQGWFNKCTKTTGYQKRGSFGLVFRGNSPTRITHMGILINASTYEMYNRLDIKPVAGGNWKWYGECPYFENESVPSDFEIKGNTCIIKNNLPGYKTAAEAAHGGEPACMVESGTYHIFNTSEKTGTVNVTRSKGVPGAWVKIPG